MEEWCTLVRAPSEGHYVSEGECSGPASLLSIPLVAGLLRASAPFISGGTDAYKVKRRKSLTDWAASSSVWHCEV